MGNLEYVDTAWEWYQKHKEIVIDLVYNESRKIKPSSENLYKPESWNSSNWAWFFENYNMN